MPLARSPVVSCSKDYVSNPDGTKEIIGREWCTECSCGMYRAPKCDFCPNGFAVSVVTSTIMPNAEKWVCYICADNIGPWFTVKSGGIYEAAVKK